MNIIDNAINKNYNQFKEELNEMVWKKLNEKISDVDTETSKELSNFSSDS